MSQEHGLSLSIYKNLLYRFQKEKSRNKKCLTNVVQMFHAGPMNSRKRNKARESEVPVEISLVGGRWTPPHGTYYITR